MRSNSGFLVKDKILTFSVLVIVSISIIILISLDSSLFPAYFIYLSIAVIGYWFFSQINFDITSLFYKYFYIISIILLILPIVLGQVTRGTIRWIPIGVLSFQPAEIVRPFLLVFFAKYLTDGKITLVKALKSFGLLLFPAILILVQPSLGVTILTLIGFFGVVIACKFDKKYILIGLVIVIGLLPIFWQFLAQYQKQRIMTFIHPSNDPLGAGYNSLQSTIAVGSGKITGMGLGKGTQTQLAYLPEKQTDFVFAAIGEELGMIGATLILIAGFVMLWRFTQIMENSVSPAARAYVSGFFLTFLAQLFIHVGMNLGMLPVTGVPFPLLSAGGSSLLATMIGLGIVASALKK